MSRELCNGGNGIEEKQKRGIMDSTVPESLELGTLETNVRSSQPKPKESNIDVTVLVDYRENRGGLPLLHLFETTTHSMKWQRACLPVGDIQFVLTDDTQQVLLIVERKAAADFVGSIKSGHFTEQRQRLVDSGARVAVLYESIEPDLIITRSCLKMQLLEKFMIVHSFNTRDTFTWITQAYEYLSQGSELRHTGGRFALQSRKSQLQQEFQQRVFTLIHGVTPEIADELVKKFNSVANLIIYYLVDAKTHAQAVKEIAEIQIPGRKKRKEIGKSLAMEILRMLQLQKPTENESSDSKKKGTRKKRKENENESDTEETPAAGPSQQTKQEQEEEVDEEETMETHIKQTKRLKRNQSGIKTLTRRKRQ